MLVLEELAVVGLLAAATLGLAAYTLNYYAAKSLERYPVAIYLLLLWLYFITYIPVPLLLVDSHFASVGKDTTKGYLYYAWEVIYWTVILFAWFLCPVMMMFVGSGHFTFGERLKGAVIANLKLYAAIAVVCAIMLCYLVFAQGMNDFNDILNIGKTASNAYGLSLMMCLLGYALVQVPGTYISLATLERYKLHMEFEARTLHENYDEAKLDWSDMQKRLLRYEAHLDPSCPLKPMIKSLLELTRKVDIDILALCTPLMNNSACAGFSASEGEAKDLKKSDLVELHRQLLLEAHNLMKTEYCWRTHRYHYYFVENVDIVKRDGAGNVRHGLPEEGFPNKLCHPLSSLYWLYMRTLIMTLTGLFLGLLSLAVLWSEVIWPLKPKWSVIMLIVDVLSDNVLVEALMLLLLAYIAWCCYWTLFKLKLFALYELVPRQSNPAHLFWAGGMLCRLIMPLCYNFLKISLRHQDSGIMFQKVFPEVDTSVLLGPWFQLYAISGLLLIVVVLSLFRGFTMCWSLFDKTPFNPKDPEVIEMIDQGRQLMNLCRSRDGIDRLDGPAQNGAARMRGISEGL